MRLEHFAHLSKFNTLTLISIMSILYVIHFSSIFCCQKYFLDYFLSGWLTYVVQKCKSNTQTQLLNVPILYLLYHVQLRVMWELICPASQLLQL